MSGIPAVVLGLLHVKIDTAVLNNRVNDRLAHISRDHHRDLMMAIEAGKHVVCEKPFTDTADQAKEVYDAAAKAGVVCWEGMWLRSFPAVEHARMAMERGDIGDVKVVTADYPDWVYALNPAITGFGADEMPVIAAAGRKSQPQPYANDVYSAHGASPSGAVLQSGEQ